MTGRLNAVLDRARPSWWDGAACRTTKVRRLVARGAADFFPERGRSAGTARDICADCPVRIECLDWALDQGPWLHGMFGGTTRAERRRELDRRSAS